MEFKMIIGMLLCIATANAVPTVSDANLTSTSGFNVTADNLTLSYNSNVSGNITDFMIAGVSWASLNVPMDYNNTTGTRDYSTNKYTTVLGVGAGTLPLWTASGKVGGAAYYANYTIPSGLTGTSYYTFSTENDQTYDDISAYCLENSSTLRIKIIRTTLESLGLEAYCWVEGEGNPGNNQGHGWISLGSSYDDARQLYEGSVQWGMEYPCWQDSVPPGGEDLCSSFYTMDDVSYSATNWLSGAPSSTIWVGYGKDYHPWAGANPPPPPVCGDGICNNGESGETCWIDCHSGGGGLGGGGNGTGYGNISTEDLPTFTFFANFMKWLDEFLKGCTYGLSNTGLVLLGMIMLLLRKQKSDRIGDFLNFLVLFAIALIFFYYGSYIQTACAVI